MVTSPGDYALYLLGATNNTNPYSSFFNSIRAPYSGYSFPTDSRGRSVLPTMATLDQASSADDKLAIAGQLADVIEIQVNAATRTGRPDRVAEMTASNKEVLDAVRAVVDGMKTTDGSVKAGDSDPALEPYQKKLAKVLGTLHDNLAKISDLLSKAKKDVAAQTDKDIQRLDVRGGALASLAGLVWESLPSSGGADDASATPTDPTKLLDIFV